MIYPANVIEATPTRTRERVALLDILRGLALLGILLVNMEDFSAPNTPGLATVWPDAPDRMVGWILRFAAEGKFRAVFSFLFGLGFAMQLRRAQDAPEVFKARYLRRIVTLLLIGIAHYLLLWEADILMTYALVGLLLLPFAARSVQTTLRAAAGLAGLAVTLLSLIAFFATPRPGGTAHAGSTPPVSAEKVHEATVYSRGRYREVVIYRAQAMGTQLARFVPLAPLTLMLFLLGLAAGQAGLVQEPAQHRALLRRVFVGCLLFGLAANALVTLYAFHLMALPRLMRLPIVASYVLGGPALGLAYVAGATLFLLPKSRQARLGALAAAGRMALTNYLLQSVVCTTVFYGYGLGRYNHTRPIAGVGLCIALFAIQMFVSVCWLRWFRYGPAEWLWRSLTYLRPLPLRLPSEERTLPFT